VREPRGVLARVYVLDNVDVRVPLEQETSLCEARRKAGEVRRWR
jgi:hypothetical protein